MNEYGEVWTAIPNTTKIAFDILMDKNKNLIRIEDLPDSIGVSDEPDPDFLYTRTLNDVLNDHKLLTDPAGKTGAFFYPSMAKSGEHTENIYLHSDVATLFDTLADGERMGYSDIMRHTIVLGLAMYMHEIGNTLNEIYAAKRAAILAGDTGAIFDVQTTCRLPTGYTRRTCRISGHLFDTVTRTANRAGICKGKFIGYLVAKALRTHNDVTAPKWTTTLQYVIEECEDRIRYRVDKIQ